MKGFLPLIPIIMALLAGAAIVSFVAIVEPLSLIAATLLTLYIFMKIDKLNVFSKNEMLDKGVSFFVGLIIGYIVYKVIGLLFAASFLLAVAIVFGIIYFGGKEFVYVLLDRVLKR